MIRECLPDGWKCEDSGFWGRVVIAGALTFVLLGGSGVALAGVEPYCPSEHVPVQGHQMFDIEKLCALVHGDLVEGQPIDVEKRIVESRRLPAETAPSERPRVRSTPKGSLSREKPSTPAPAPASAPVRVPVTVVSPHRGGVGSRGHREAVARPVRPPRSVSARGGNTRRVGRRKHQDHDSRSPRRVIRVSPTATPLPSPSSSAPRSSPSPVAAGGEGDARGRSVGVSSDVGRPFGAALVFGLLVMLLGAVLIVHRRFRPGMGVTRSSAGSAAGRSDARGEGDTVAAGVGERANAQLKTWRILRCCPSLAGQLVKAVLVLQLRQSR